MDDNDECRFFDENDKNKLLNHILNTDYSDEDSVWDLALELEHVSIVLRRSILEYDEIKGM